MKNIGLLLIALLFTTSVWAQSSTWNKSPELEALIVELKQHYASDDLFTIDKRSMKQVDNLSFFIQYIDKPDTPEYQLLKAYLWGMQEAHIRSVNRQIETNVVPWFCPKGLLKTFSHNAKNPTQFIENIVWQGLDYTLKNTPNRFRRPDLPAAFGTTSGFISDGLQAKYPCYERSARVF